MEKIKELKLLLLYLTSWKEKDIFGDESTYLTETGVNKAKELMKKYNIE